MNWTSVLIFGPGIFAALAWLLIWRNKRQSNKIELAAVITASLIALWAISLTVRMHMHPEYAKLPPWQDPVNLDAGLLMLCAPIPIVLGFIAAARKAPWWLVLLVELVSLPLMLVGCAAAVSV